MPRSGSEPASREYRFGAALASLGVLPLAALVHRAVSTCQHGRTRVSFPDTRPPE